MIELSKEQLSVVTPIFTGLTHDRAVVFSVLEGTNPGRAFVDNAAAPTVALVYPQAAFIYLGGTHVDQAISNKTVDLISDVLLPDAGEREAIIFPCSDSWRKAMSSALAGQGGVTIYRKTFSLDEAAFAPHRDWRGLVPMDMEMRRIDRELAERTGVAYGTWRNIDDFLSKGFGFCLTEDDRIVSTCSTVFVGDGEAEIDISTTESYRRRGYATLVAAAFVEHSLGHGIRPNWACWRERTSSVALARKLGFADQPEIPVILWPQRG